MVRWIRLLLLGLLCLQGLCMPALAQNAQVHEPGGERSEGRRVPLSETERLPAEAVTHHAIELPGRSLRFTAKTGSLTLIDPQGTPQAEIGYVAYIRDDADPATRPVTFAVNGGPGASSAYLHLLALGPWRLPLEEGAVSPSAPTNLVPNNDTWLDFTDLVFIDPPGTGYSRVVGGDQAREHFYSVQGDIDGLAASVLRWLKENDRLRSPKFYVGESYGGFRGPLLADRLQSDQGIGLSGLILISPVLDFSWLDTSSPWIEASRLPSLAAARMEGPLTRDKLRTVEDYASGEYLSDLMRGLRDKDAVERISARVAQLTGLDPVLVKRWAGRVAVGAYQREAVRGNGQIVSAYDAKAVGYDPDPNAAYSRFEDPVLTGLTASLSSAILDHLGRTLNYKVDGRYNLLNESVSRAWRWGGGRGSVNNLDELRQALALDPKLRVLVAHGFTDLVTPYYASQLLLNQLPDYGSESRVKLQVYDGGHMFYARDASRQALRGDVERLFEEALQARDEPARKD